MATWISMSRGHRSSRVSILASTTWASLLQVLVEHEQVMADGRTRSRRALLFGPDTIRRFWKIIPFEERVQFHARWTSQNRLFDVFLQVDWKRMGSLGLICPCKEVGSSPLREVSRTCGVWSFELWKAAGAQVERSWVRTTCQNKAVWAFSKQVELNLHVGHIVGSFFFWMYAYISKSASLESQAQGTLSDTRHQEHALGRKKATWWWFGGEDTLPRPGYWRLPAFLLLKSVTPGEFLGVGLKSAWVC